MQVHPLFDINEQVWVTESGVVAQSLRELQRKLPKAKIVGYYPQGFDFKNPPRQPGDPWPAVRTNYSISTTSKMKIRSSAKTDHNKQEEKYWAKQKRTYEEVQQEVDGDAPEQATEAVVVEELATAVQAFAEQPEPFKSTPTVPHKTRASPMYRGGASPRWDDEADTELGRHVRGGFSSGQIGQKMGRTRNSIIGRCHRLGYKLQGKRGGI